MRGELGQTASRRSFAALVKSIVADPGSGWELLYFPFARCCIYPLNAAGTDLLTRLVDEETSRAPTERELRRFKEFDGVAPHLRPGPHRAMYPTISVREIISTRSVLAYVLAREYGLSIPDVRRALGCEDDLQVEKLLAVGDEIAPGSAVVARMKDEVLKAAQGMIAAAGPVDAKQRVAQLIERPPSTPAALSGVEMKLLRIVLVHLMLRKFEFGKANLRPLLGYPTGGALVLMMFQGERILNFTSYRKEDLKIVVTAARAIVAIAGLEKPERKN